MLLIDRERVAAQASRGNAGALAFSDILPLASPRNPAQGAALAARSAGSAGDPSQLSAAPRTVALSLLAREPARPRAREHRGAGGDDGSVRRRDAVVARRRRCRPHDAQRRRAASLRERGTSCARREPGWQVRADHGIAFTHLHGPRAIAELQPGLSPALVAATFVPRWKTVSDPLQVTEALAHGSSSSAGGRIAARGGERTRVRHRRRRRASPRRPPLVARRVVVAAGAWSHHLARTLGEHIPLETERGYNTTLPVGAFDLKRQLIFGDHGFVVTPLGSGVRVGGAVEFAGLDAPPNFARAASDARQGQALHAGPAHRRRHRSGWAFVRRCRIRCRRSARPPPTSASSTRSAMATWASRNRPRRRASSPISSRDARRRRPRAVSSATIRLTTREQIHDHIPHARHRSPSRHGADRSTNSPCRSTTPAGGREAVRVRARGPQARASRRTPGRGSSSCRAARDFPARGRYQLGLAQARARRLPRAAARLARQRTQQRRAPADAGAARRRAGAGRLPDALPRRQHRPRLPN